MHALSFFNGKVMEAACRDAMKAIDAAQGAGGSPQQLDAATSQGTKLALEKIAEIAGLLANLKKDLDQLDREH